MEYLNGSYDYDFMILFLVLKSTPWKFQTKIAISGVIMTDFLYFGAFWDRFGGVCRHQWFELQIFKQSDETIGFFGPKNVFPEIFRLKSPFRGKLW